MAAINDINPEALTIIQYAKMSNDPLVRKIGKSFLQVRSAFEDIPLPTLETLRRRGFRWVDQLPTVNYTALNVPPVVTVGSPTAWAEQVYVLANQFQVDELYLLDENSVGNPLDQQIKIWMKSAFQFDFNWKFINNGRGGSASNPTIYEADDPNAPVGLKTRMNNAVQYGCNPENLINAAVTVTETMVVNDALNLFEVLDVMLSYMDADDGEGIVFYMNDYMQRRIARAGKLLGAGGGFDMTKDEYDRRVMTYRGAKLRDLGRTAPQPGGVQTTRIVSSTEAADGTDVGTGNYTSIYGVRYGLDHFSGWQMRDLKPRNLGLDPTNGTIYNVVIRYPWGLWQEDTRAITRAYGFNLGAQAG